MKKIKTSVIILITLIYVCLVGDIFLIFRPVSFILGEAAIAAGTLSIHIVMAICVFVLTSTNLQEAARSDLEKSQLQEQLKATETKLSQAIQKASKQPEQAADMQELQKKVNALESFRNAFPLKVSDTYAIYNIIREQLIVPAYSQWLVTGEYNNELFCVQIVRPYKQTYHEMITLSFTTREPKELLQFDTSNTSMYE